MSWYATLIGLVAVERLAELVIARRNNRWIQLRGAVESGARHYPVMVVLHLGLLAGAVTEVWLGHRPFLPVLGWIALAVVIAAQGLRWWCIATLGHQWNTRILVAAGLPRITTGPYRFLSHPNYLAVVLEGAALPLVHTAWITATAFTVLNAALLRVRISSENQALATLTACRVRA